MQFVCKIEGVTVGAIVGVAVGVFVTIGSDARVGENIFVVSGVLLASSTGVDKVELHDVRIRMLKDIRDKDFKICIVCQPLVL